MNKDPEVREDYFVKRTDEALYKSQLNTAYYELEQRFAELQAKHKEQYKYLKIVQRNYGLLHEKHAALMTYSSAELEALYSICSILKIKTSGVFANDIRLLQDYLYRLLATNLRLQLERKPQIKSARLQTAAISDNYNTQTEVYYDAPETNYEVPLCFLEQAINADVTERCENAEIEYRDVAVQCQDLQSRPITLDCKAYLVLCAGQMRRCGVDLMTLRQSYVEATGKMADTISRLTGLVQYLSLKAQYTSEYDIIIAKQNNVNATLRYQIENLESNCRIANMYVSDVKEVLCSFYQLNRQTQQQVAQLTCEKQKAKGVLYATRKRFYRALVFVNRLKLLVYRYYQAEARILANIGIFDADFHYSSFTLQLCLQKSELAAKKCDMLARAVRPYKRLTFDVSTSAACTPVPKMIATPSAVVLPDFLYFLDHVHSLLVHLQCESVQVVDDSCYTALQILAAVNYAAVKSDYRCCQFANDSRRTVAFLNCACKALNQKCIRIAELRESQLQFSSSLTQSPRSHDRISRLERYVSRDLEKREKEAAKFAEQQLSKAQTELARTSYEPEKHKAKTIKPLNSGRSKRY